MIESAALVEKCLADGEFMMAARHWTGGLRLVTSDGADGEPASSESASSQSTEPALSGFEIVDGVPRAGVPNADSPERPAPGVISLTATAEIWEAMTQPVPVPFLHDVTAALGRGVSRRSDELLWWQYAPAIQRAVELLAEPREAGKVSASDAGPLPRTDSPVGRYIHLDLGGVDHRIYYEEAGSGIPLLLQHTAGSHGTQWRHLFENRAITDRFRLIAYDLPYHGKSVPPVGEQWWSREYALGGDFLRSIPLGLSEALDLDRPVFMGCSVGGLLALDLAARHADRFSHVISLEGALHIGGDPERLTGFWHPQVSNETKARMMQALTSPTSPDAYRKETIQTYASGWPPVFIGDLFYYLVDYDLRDTAAEIDTDTVGVHILSGEYDTSGTPALGRAAHETIAGSTFSEMKGMGHFPMSENPDAFFEYLIPVLDRIVESKS
ncbi:MAG: alpha/beta fold hydrolase [Acidimicrobiales bacterium]